MSAIEKTNCSAEDQRQSDNKRFETPDLRAKVAPLSEFELTDLVAQAEAEIARIVSSNSNWVQLTVAKLEDAVSRLRAEPEQWQKHWRNAFLVAHDIKGQGATFGHPVVAKVAASLCNFMKQEPEDRTAALEVVDSHLQAINYIGVTNMTGPDGEKVETLIAALQALSTVKAG